MDDAPTVIGLNFGTSYSCIAIINKENRPEVIANEDGDRLTPSYVAYLGDQELSGLQAKSQVLRNPKNTITQFRNLIGHSFDHATVQAYIANSSVKLVKNNEKVAFQVTLNEEEKLVNPTDVAATLIKQLKKTAEHTLGRSVTGAVIAVPLSFTKEQCALLKSACEAANLHVYQVLNEPSAAALAYDFGVHATASHPQDRNIVICDMGASTYDVTVLGSRGLVYTVLANAHNDDLGGSHFDELLMAHFAAEFKKLNKIDITGNSRANAKLRLSCEITKRTLSSSNLAPCSVESLAEGLDFHATVNRMRFDMLSNKLYTKCAQLIEQVLAAADLQHWEIHEVILIGGASRMVKYQSKIRNIFTLDSTKIRVDIEPDEAIAIGCAYQAALVSAYDEEDIVASIESDITAASHLTKPIGVVAADGQFVTLIPAHTPIPVIRTVEFGNAEDSQADVYVAIFEGEHCEVKPSEKKEKSADAGSDEEEEEEELPIPHLEPRGLLAELVLRDLPTDVKKAESKIEVTLQINNTGALIASVRSWACPEKVVKVEVPASVA